jgi:PhzF family phenazine biosynthesis protein
MADERSLPPGQLASAIQATSMAPILSTGAAMPHPHIPPVNQAVMVRVFLRAQGEPGGNPVPLTPDARGMTAQQMQAVAQASGHESAFVFPPEVAGNTLRLRYFVPGHEMEMCGHATVGALWALRQWGIWEEDEARVETPSGVVHGRWDAAVGQAWISQPAVTVQALDDAALPAIAKALRVEMATLAMVNASTSRVKTLIAMPDVATLDALTPDFSAMEALCGRIGSTGLYPYAIESVSAQGSVVHARQFPKSSGYPEDAATGVAAAALWGHLAGNRIVPIGTPDAPVPMTVIQGVAMGSPSAIDVLPRFDDDGQVIGCWLGGKVDWAAA